MEMKEGTVEIWVFHLSHLTPPPPSLLRSLENLATHITVLWKGQSIYCIDAKHVIKAEISLE